MHAAKIRKQKIKKRVSLAVNASNRYLLSCKHSVCAPKLIAALLVVGVVVAVVVVLAVVVVVTVVTVVADILESIEDGS